MTFSIGDLISVKPEFQDPTPEDPDNWIYMIVGKQWGLRGREVSDVEGLEFCFDVEFFKILHPEGYYFFADRRDSGMEAYILVQKSTI